MVSDDERREVAERLRSVAREVDRGGFSETIKHVKLAVFEDLDRYRPSGTLDRLADLIDPTCLARADVEDTPDGGQFECWSCSVCGNIVSVDPDYDTETDGPAYCEACGHRIVGKGEPTWL